jgi:methionyl-tRNA formyltransferase
LQAAGHDIALVITQPDRPAGRGQRPLESAVKRFAKRQGMPLWQPETLREPGAVERVGDAQADALVVAAYGALLPPVLLNVGRFGALNIHASLLPRWRGAAPIQRAILAGDRETGVSIMQMDEGLDTGPVLAQRKIEIGPRDDAGVLHDELAALGARLMVETLVDLQAGRAHATAQPAAGATYARKIEKVDTLLDWSRPAAELERAVRAFRPGPGAVADYGGESLKIWSVRVRTDRGAPGTVLESHDALVVACGEQSLEIVELQRPGGKRMAASSFLRGRSIAAGTRFA